MVLFQGLFGFALIGMCHSKRLQASRRIDAKDDNDSSALLCLCQEPQHSQFMIQGDTQERKCKIWYRYHGD